MTQKLVYPSASRNAAPIFECLERHLPTTGKILEMASGSGQHLSALANRHPRIRWQPSDKDATARASINAWRMEENGGNLLPPLDIDAMKDGWWHKVAAPVEGMMAINMIHVAPFAACEGLMKGAGRLLAPGGFLFLYGPYKIDGAHTSASNAAFDASLRAQNPEWGLRDKTLVSDAAAVNGLAFAEMIAMPANNFSLIFRKD